MSSLQSHLLKMILRWQKLRRNPHATIAEKREIAERLLAKLSIPKGVTFKNWVVGNVSVLQTNAKNNTTEHTILLLHGGAYLLGSPTQYRSFTAYLALACRAKVVAPDYRLAPEHPFPAALDDAVQVYEWLYKRGDTKQLVCVGDSAGGGLTLAMLLKIKEKGLPMPAAAALICPWVDLTCASESYEILAEKDVILTKADLMEAARLYGGEHALTDPLISPLFADLQGFSPLLIYAAGHDILRDEARKLTEKARQSGISVIFHEEPDMPHVWPIFGTFVPEARKAIYQIADFAKQHWL